MPKNIRTKSRQFVRERSKDRRVQNRSSFMLENEGKLQCKIIKSRLKKRTDHNLEKHQFGF